jgi:hypothetical protein
LDFLLSVVDRLSGTTNKEFIRSLPDKIAQEKNLRRTNRPRTAYYGPRDRDGATYLIPPYLMHLAQSGGSGRDRALEELSDLYRSGRLNYEQLEGFFNQIAFEAGEDLSHRMPREHRRSRSPRLSRRMADQARNMAYDAHSDLPLLLRDLDASPSSANNAQTEDANMQRAIAESIATPTPPSTAKLPTEPIPGDGTCAVCYEGTAQMLLCKSNGKPACRCVCMCEYCAHELAKTMPTCPKCRAPYDATKLLKIFVEKPDPAPPAPSVQSDVDPYAPSAPPMPPSNLSPRRRPKPSAPLAPYPRSQRKRKKQPRHLPPLPSYESAARLR